MKPISALLVLTDLSPPSRHAVVRAAMLAKETNSKLDLLHVLEGGALEHLRTLLGQDAGSVTARLLNDTRASLDELADATCGSLGVSPGVHLATGALLSEIASRAEACDADVIALGAQGAGFWRHLVLGSTAERLLRKTLRPLLVVRQTPREPYRRVLVPVDFSSWTLASIAAARAIAPEAELILFNAFEVPFEGKLRFAGVDEEHVQFYRSAAQKEAEIGLRTIAEQAGLAGTRFRCVVAHGDPSSRIVESQQEQDIDLVVIGKHGKGMTEELLLGSTTKHVLAQVGCDVLVTQRA